MKEGLPTLVVDRAGPAGRLHQRFGVLIDPGRGAQSQPRAGQQHAGGHDRSVIVLIIGIAQQIWNASTGRIR